MTLPLTPDMLAAAYEFLRTTPPFCRWALPEADYVTFRVLNSNQDYGAYHYSAGSHTIDCSCKMVGHTETLMSLMGHEMIHMRLAITGKEYKNIKAKPTVHNAAFKKYASQVCRVHGFDPKAFY